MILSPIVLAGSLSVVNGKVSSESDEKADRFGSELFGGTAEGPPWIGAAKADRFGSEVSETPSRGRRVCLGFCSFQPKRFSCFRTAFSLIPIRRAISQLECPSPLRRW